MTAGTPAAVLTGRAAWEKRFSGEPFLARLARVLLV